MRILIIEDEKLNANRLRRMLVEIGLTDIDQFVPKSISESVSHLNNFPMPDLIMMDIRLSDGLSFEIFDQVNVLCPVIFTTAYDEYAFRAFKVNSIDYLLKPIDADELLAAIKKYQYRSVNKYERADFEGLGGYMNSVRPVFRQRFLVPLNDGFKALRSVDMQVAFTENKITYLLMGDGLQYAISQSLDDLEDQLDPQLFFRANRQTILHVDSIASIHNHFNSKLKIVTKKPLPFDVIISKQRVPFLKAWLNR